MILTLQELTLLKLLTMQYILTPPTIQTLTLLTVQYDNLRFQQSKHLHYLQYNTITHVN